MNNKYYLITSRCHDFYGNKDKNFLLLGNWLLRFGGNLSSKYFKVLDYHWDDRKKFNDDCKYLEDVYERFLNKVTIKLNFEHKTNYPQRYWRILVGPWLSEFIQILYDRWENINHAISMHEISGASAVDENFEKLIPKDMADFHLLMVDDGWNEAIIGCLLKFKKIHVDFSKEISSQKFIERKKYFSLKNKLKKILSSISRYFIRKSDYLFISTYFSIWRQAILLMRLGQIPHFLYSGEGGDFNFLVWSKLRVRNEYCKSDDFEVVLESLLYSHIPIAYLEGYNELIDSCKQLKWPDHPKVIFTSNSFETDDLFKAWTAFKVTTQDAKLIIGQHGGDYGTMKYFLSENHQLKICDYFISWGWTYPGKDFVIPLGYFLPTAKRKLNSASNKIMLIEGAVPRYSIHLASTFISTQWLDYFNYITLFCEKLPEKLKESLCVRLYPRDYGWDKKLRWRGKINAIKFDDNSITLLNSIRESRVCICTYNGTTFFECMVMNVPTLIFWDKDFFELNEYGESMLSLLENAGIFHSTPESAAEHLTNIWDSLEAWWESSKVQFARAEFCKKFARLDSVRFNNDFITLFKKIKMESEVS